MPGTARVKATPALIPASLVKKYVKVATLAAAREKQRKKLRDDLVPRLQAGATVDPKSAYDLYLLEVAKTKVPWREVFEKLAAQVYGAEAGAVIARLEEQYKDTEIHLKSRAMVKELADCR
jgi:hypothetical protein